MTLTRDEFEEWLDARRDDALDDVQQSDATAQKWLARLHASLKAVADQEDIDQAETEDDDDFDPEVDLDPEEDAAGSSDADEET